MYNRLVGKKISIFNVLLRIGKEDKTMDEKTRKEIEFDHCFLHEDVPQPKIVSHSNMQNFLRQFGNKKGLRILEIGSREVTGKSSARKDFSEATYVGFDYYPGENVDVVGDVHKLSSYFDEKFDIVYTLACFEHFAMPWIVAEEINKVLKVGGYIAIETHFSFTSHQRPWHFFQYSDMGLKVLFPPAMGYLCLDAGMSNPIVARFSSLADDYLKNRPLTGLYCHSEFLGQKVKEVENFSWHNLSIEDVVGQTKYPLNTLIEECEST